MDANSIFIYKTIKKTNPHIQILTELVYNTNIAFLVPKKNDLNYVFSTLFAAGEVYISSIIDKLTAQAYYNPYIVTLVQMILKGGASASKQKGNDLISSNLWQIDCPEECFNKTFEHLFEFLLDRNLLALGLYRQPGAQDNKTSYVYTNPEGATISSHDKVFVLAHEIQAPVNSGAVQIDKGIGATTDNQIVFSNYAEGEVTPLPDYYGNTQLEEKDDSQEYQQMNNREDTREEEMNDVMGAEESDLKQKGGDDLDEDQSASSSLAIMKTVVNNLHQNLDRIQDRLDNINEGFQNQNDCVEKTIKTQTKDFIEKNAQNLKKGQPLK